MDTSRRQFLGKAAAVTAGAAVVPLAEVGSQPQFPARTPRR